MIRLALVVGTNSLRTEVSDYFFLRRRCWEEHRMERGMDFGKGGLCSRSDDISWRFWRGKKGATQKCYDSSLLKSFLTSSQRAERTIFGNKRCLGGCPVLVVGLRCTETAQSLVRASCGGTRPATKTRTRDVRNLRLGVAAHETRATAAPWRQEADTRISIAFQGARAGEMDRDAM